MLVAARPVQVLRISGATDVPAGGAPAVLALLFAGAIEIVGGVSAPARPVHAAGRLHPRGRTRLRLFHGASAPRASIPQVNRRRKIPRLGVSASSSSICAVCRSPAHGASDAIFAARNNSASFFRNVKTPAVLAGLFYWRVAVYSGSIFAPGDDLRPFSDFRVHGKFFSSSGEPVSGSMPAASACPR